MPAQPSPEEWVPERKMFQFRFFSTDTQSRRTFCVPWSTLVDLCPDDDFDPYDCFAAFRPAIYTAAERRGASSDPTKQIVISADDVRSAM